MTLGTLSNYWCFVNVYVYYGNMEVADALTCGYLFDDFQGWILIGDQDTWICFRYFNIHVTVMSNLMITYINISLLSYDMNDIGFLYHFNVDIMYLNIKSSSDVFSWESNDDSFCRQFLLSESIMSCFIDLVPSSSVGCHRDLHIYAFIMKILYQFN